MTNLKSVWSTPPAHLTLSSSEVHVWSTSLTLPALRLQKLAATLSADEQSRAERFYFEQHRQRFIASRGLLRLILGCYLDIEPQKVQFCYGPYGKPLMAELKQENSLRFNLSHSQDIALYAVTFKREVGIDIEQVRSLAEAEQIAKNFFSARENAAFRVLSPTERQEVFFRYWTCKEAYLKALGDGLTRSLNSIEVSLAPGQQARLLSVKEEPQAVERWFLQELTPPAAGYAAALAVEGRDWHLKCWRWLE